MNSLTYALRLLSRDWRAGEIRLLALALFLAVTAITAVAWLADRVASVTDSQAADLLGGDRVVESTRPLDPAFAEAALQAGLAISRLVEFPSVVVYGERTQLTAVRAVDANYPPRGDLLIGDSLEGERVVAEGAPVAGNVWVEPRLLLQLDAATGDRLSLGNLDLAIDQLIFLDPAVGMGFSNFAPRLMLALDDLDATGLLQDGSRVRYKLLVAGDAPALAAFETAITPLLDRHVELERPGEDQPGVEQVISAAKRFLGLSALLTVVVGGVAMLLTIRQYAARHLDRVAIMRCLGASSRMIGWILTWKMVLIGLFAGLLGSLAGFAVQAAMLALLGELIPDLPPPGLRPALIGLAAAQVILVGFALPTVLKLRQVPPLRVLRRDLGNTLLQGYGSHLLALVAIFLLMWWQAGELRLAAIVFGAVLGTLLLLGLVSAGLVSLLRRSARMGRRSGLLLSGISRRPWTATVQIVALGLGLLALLLLSLVRDDLLATWQERIPETAANYFLINIQPAEAGAVDTLLAERELDAAVAPMVRARLLAVNDQTIDPGDYDEVRTQRLVRREFNLSWLDDLPRDNRILAGSWWTGPDPDQAGFSVEIDIAERIGIGLGDVLHFDSGGQRFSAPVTSLREVDWDSFNVNFFVIASPGLLDAAPATYISSFYLPPEQRGFTSDLVRQFPSVTVIDIDAILETVRGIIRQGSQVVEVMALLTLLSGLVVLLAALQVTREERQFESALLRALGGRRSLIRRLALSEFLLLGGLAGFIAGLGAAIAGYWLANSLFGFDAAINLWLPLVGILVGAGAVTLTGALATRRLVRVSPMRLLKDAEDH